MTFANFARRGIRSIAACAPLIVAMLVTPVRAQAPTPARLPIGMNLSGISDWSPGFPFKNLMWGARPWLTRNADRSGPFDTKFAPQIQLDEDGYPLELPVTIDGALMPDAHQKLQPELALKGQNALADGGGSEVFQACCPGNRAAIHHGDQAFEVARIHKNFFRSRIK